MFVCIISVSLFSRVHDGHRKTQTGGRDPVSYTVLVVSKGNTSDGLVMGFFASRTALQNNTKILSFPSLFFSKLSNIFTLSRKNTLKQQYSPQNPWGVKGSSGNNKQKKYIYIPTI